MSDREDLIAEARFARGAYPLDSDTVALLDRLADALESAPQATPDDARERVARAIHAELPFIGGEPDGLHESESDYCWKFADAALAALAQATPTADSERAGAKALRDYGDAVDYIRDAIKPRRQELGQ